jgi:hypothetical protein
METNVRGESQPALVIRVHLTDGSVESFAQNDEAAVQELWQKIEPSRLFAPPRIVLAGDHSKSVFVTAQIVRVDFVRESRQCWEFIGGYSDIVELSESEFRKNARLDQPELMAKRTQHTPVGDMLVSFLKLHMTGGNSVFVMAEFPVKLPAENQSFMRFLLSKGAFHMRLRGGGVAVVNLANLVGYTVYPGVAEVPADTWLAEPIGQASFP